MSSLRTGWTPERWREVQNQLRGHLTEELRQILVLLGKGFSCTGSYDRHRRGRQPFLPWS